MVFPNLYNMAPIFRPSSLSRCLLSSSLVSICTAARDINVDANIQARQAVAFWGGSS
jgi:hypothetical protein